MRNYIIRRILTIIPMFFIISFISFILINLSPSDPAEIILRANGVPVITEELIEATKIELGLDQPFLVRYVNWLNDVIHLDFGKSYVTQKPVFSMISPAFDYTMQLALANTIVTITLSIFLGIICALFEGRLIDRGTRSFLFVISAMPAFWIGTLAIWFFSVKLKLLPTSGVGSWTNFVLPTMVMSIGYCGFYFRMIRNSMLENMNENYVIYARSCGVKEQVVVKHIFRNSIQTAVAAFCMAIPGMMAGTVVIENVFAWPGLGRLCVSSIFNRDLPIIQAYVLILALSYCLFNIFGDVVNAVLNPKLRKA